MQTSIKHICTIIFISILSLYHPLLTYSQTHGQSTSLQACITTHDALTATQTTIRMNHGKSTMANAEGYYMIEGATVGEHLLEVKLLGTDLQTHKITLKEGVNKQDFVLSHSA